MALVLYLRVVDALGGVNGAAVPEVGSLRGLGALGHLCAVDAVSRTHREGQRVLSAGYTLSTHTSYVPRLNVTLKLEAAWRRQLAH